jgi:hypothetical protein
MTAKHPQALDLKRLADILTQGVKEQRKLLRQKEGELKEVKLAVIKHFHGVTVGSTVIYKGNEYKVTKVDTSYWDYPFEGSLKEWRPPIQIRMGNEYPWLYFSAEWKPKPEQAT